MFSFLLILSLTGAARADAEGAVRMEIEGMTCVGCEAKLRTALDGLDFVAAATASTAMGQACVELSGPLDKSALEVAITDLGYTLEEIETIETCKDSPGANGPPSNWAETDGLDVVVISRGERVDLTAHRAAGKFTIYDFGAPWCAPCHATEKLLKVYLRDHPDTAVRAIVLDDPDPKVSYAMPVVSQHLSMAPGLPHFIVVDPAGRTVFTGSEVDKLLNKVDRKRK